MDSAIEAFISSLPSPPPPLRYLFLQRHEGTRFTAAALGTLAAAGSGKLATLERLDMWDLDTSAFGALTQLHTCPALTGMTVCLHMDWDMSAAERAHLEAAEASFTAAGCCFLYDFVPYVH